MHNDDSLNVTAWRPESQTPPLPGRTDTRKRKNAQPAPDDGKAAPVVKSAKPVKAAEREQLSLDELAENLRRMNMTFDLFEIQAKFLVDKSDRQVKVIVQNTKTGEVIRSIPPTEFSTIYNRFVTGIGSTFSSTV